MALDFGRIKQAQAKAQSSGGFEKKDYTKIYFKPALGKQTVRIVPWKEDKTFPIIECELHSFDAFKKYIPTLRNFGEKDPIVDFRKKVFDKGTEEDKVQVKKFAPKVNRYVQVVVIGQEGLGVRLWELNKTNYEALLSILSEEEEYGDISSITNGRNIIVEGANDSLTLNGRTITYIAVSMKVSVKVTPLSNDPAQVEEWLEKQYVPIEQYKKYTAEEIQQILSDYLTPEDEEGTNEDSTTTAPAPPVATPAAKVLATLKPKPVVKKVEPIIEELVAEEITGEDELSELIPQVAPAPIVKKVPVKAVPVAKAVPATLAAKKFASIFEDDEE